MVTPQVRPLQVLRTWFSTDWPTDAAVTLVVSIKKNFSMLIFMKFISFEVIVLIYAGRSPVTLVVTSDTLFLAKENFAHWPLPRIQDLLPKEALLPPYLDVEEKSITDVEKIVSIVCTYILYHSQGFPQPRHLN